jgi:hypothetical protein
VIRDWKKHVEELPDLYSSPNIGNMRWAGNVERMGDGIGANKFLAGNHEKERPPEKPCRRREDNIKIDFKGI